MDLFSYAERYPNAVGWKRRETSKAAADATAPRAPRLRQLCLDTLRMSEGLTADETAERLNIDRLSVRPRFSELAAMNRIVDSGERRLNASKKRAIVWVLAS